MPLEELVSSSVRLTWSLSEVTFGRNKFFLLDPCLFVAAELSEHFHGCETLFSVQTELCRYCCILTKTSQERCFGENSHFK